MVYPVLFPLTIIFSSMNVLVLITKSSVFGSDGPYSDGIILSMLRLLFQQTLLSIVWGLFPLIDYPIIKTSTREKVEIKTEKTMGMLMKVCCKPACYSGTSYVKRKRVEEPVDNAYGDTWKSRLKFNLENPTREIPCRLGVDIKNKLEDGESLGKLIKKVDYLING